MNSLWHFRVCGLLESGFSWDSGESASTVHWGYLAWSVGTPVGGLGTAKASGRVVCGPLLSWLGVLDRGLLWWVGWVLGLGLTGGGLVAGAAWVSVVGWWVVLGCWCLVLWSSVHLVVGGGVSCLRLRGGVAGWSWWVGVAGVSDHIA